MFILTLTLILTLNPKTRAKILTLILVSKCNAITPSDIGAAGWRVGLNFSFSFAAGTITYRLYLQLPDE